MIFVRSERSAQRVFASVQHFLTQRLKLVVNEQKSSVRLSSGCEYLGFTFVGKRVTIKASPKKLKAFQRRIKELTGRSRGISMQRRLTDLNRYVRGWIGYFGLARQFDDLDGCRVFFLAARGVEFGCATGNSGVVPARRFATLCGLA